MRGVKYTYTLNIPNDKQIEKDDLLMDDLINDIKNKYSEFYGFKPKLSPHIVYNIVKRPKTANQMFRNTLSIKKSLLKDI